MTYGQKKVLIRKMNKTMKNIFGWMIETFRKNIMTTGLDITIFPATLKILLTQMYSKYFSTCVTEK